MLFCSEIHRKEHKRNENPSFTCDRLASKQRSTSSASPGHLPTPAVLTARGPHVTFARTTHLCCIPLWFLPHRISIKRSWGCTQLKAALKICTGVCLSINIYNGQNSTTSLFLLGQGYLVIPQSKSISKLLQTKLYPTARLLNRHSHFVW